jgi:hypothetical protein
MSSIESASIDSPTRQTVSVVNLFQPDTGGYHNLFHPAGVLNCQVRIGVERLDKHAATPVSQAGNNKGSRILNAQ